MIEKSRIPFPLIKLVSRVRGGIHAFRHHHPLYSGHSELKPFFIVGCGRSGNTLLRAMLVASEQLSIPPESYVIPRLVRQFIARGYWPWDKLITMVIKEFESFEEFDAWNISLSGVYDKALALPPEGQSLASIIDLIYQEYSLARHNKILRWGDKTPKNSEFLEHLATTFPKAQYIHLIRDPRAVYLSYRHSKIQAYQGPDGPTAIVRFWLNCHEHIERCKQLNPESFSVVHYDDLVRAPEDSLMTISEFLDIGYNENMLAYWQNPDLGDVQAHAHHANVMKPVTSSSIYKWQTDLPADERQYVEKHCLAYYHKLCKQYPIQHPM